MDSLPDPVLNFIQTLAINQRSPAYIRAEKTGCLSAWGGKLIAYGVTNLQPGQPVNQQILFLEGLLPLDGSPIFLSCVKTPSGKTADIHIFSNSESDWVLFLDATIEERQYSLIQQQGNDLNLLRQTQSLVLNQYFDNNIAAGILNLTEKGERKEVTILFAQVCGITAYSDQNSAELTLKIFNLYLTSMIQQILSEAGLVDKIIGDAIAAFFGVLPSTGCHRNQAVTAAFKMIQAVKEIRKTWQAETASEIDIRIGIASGPVTLGILGGKLHKTFNGIGYYVNLAARLESKARRGEILIDQNTFSFLASTQQNFSQTNLSFPGIVEPITIYSWLVK